MAEKKYIGAEAFNSAIREAVRRYPNTFYNGLETARKIAYDFPAADVRPVVLCRDCIFRSNEWTGCPKLNGTITGDDFFCKCGKKREES